MIKLLLILLAVVSFLPTLAYSQQWQYISAMKHARGDHRIVQLDDGKILVVGGHDGFQALRSCEIYDPLMDAWNEPSPSIFQHLLSKAKDGKLLCRIADRISYWC